MKFVKIHLMEKALMAILLCSWIGCATVNKTSTVKGKVSSEPMATLYIPITKTVTITKHDTIRPKRSDTELQQFLEGQYKINADKFITPLFTKLANSNQSLVNMMASMRQRAIAHNDSLSAENKKYINAALAATALSIKYQKEAIDARREYDAKIQEQIKSNDRTSLICMIGLIVLATIVISLFLYCRSRFRSLDKRLSHA